MTKKIALKLNDIDREVWRAIEGIVNEMQLISDEVNFPIEWVSTRKIAEVCGINIYQARYSLMKLKAMGEVRQKPAARKTPSQWLPVRIRT